MTTRSKAALAAIVVIAIVATVAFTIYRRDRATVSVQLGSVVRQDLTQTVAANGEIKPKKYVNISSNAFGRIIYLPVKEGDAVREGDLLIRLEAVQTEAEVRAAQATLEGAQSDLEGMEASIRSAEAAANTARADLLRSEADFTRSRLSFGRSEQMNRDGLISKEQFDRAKADFDIAAAQVNAGKARVEQTEAQVAQAHKQRDGVTFRIRQQQASLTRARDQFSKTTILSPLSGVITHLPVNEGEIAIVGVQNQPGTVLMTIADMSVITAEVQVDETDIVNVKVGQAAEIRVDALPGRVLAGHVSEVGNSAITRTGGLTTTATTTQEAKDFKVVVTLDNPPPELRPGLSCTATIVTATRSRVVTVPIQSLAVREIDPAPASDGDRGVIPTVGAAPVGKKVEQQGVFLVQREIAVFTPVQTGIIGATDIEITKGVSEGAVIVTGTYQALRTLKDNARVRVERQNRSQP